MKGLRILAAGLFSGLLLAGVLKAAEVLTGHRVYTLLLNVDYIPVLKEFQFSEGVEVSFHLIVSVLLCFCLYAAIRHFKIRHALLFCMVVNVIIAGCLYPVTALSDRTPPLSSIPSIAIWTGCHLVYGLAVGLLLAAVQEEKADYVVQTFDKQDNLPR